MVIQPLKQYVKHDWNILQVCEAMNGKRLLISDGVYRTIDCQVHCFLENSYILVDSFPATFDERKEQLYFVVENKSLSLKAVITNIDGFMKKTYFCFFCARHFSGRGNQHKCR